MTQESVQRRFARDKKTIMAFLAAGGQIGADYTDEQARDAVGAALRGLHGLGITLDDVANTITLDVGDAGAMRAALGLGAAALLGSASAADYRAAMGKVLTAAVAWEAAQPVPLVDAPTIALDFGAMINGTVTLTANRTLGNPVNAKPSQSGWIEFVQGAGGSKALAFGSFWRNTANITLSAAEGARDSLYFTAKAANRIEVTGLTRAIG